MIRILIADDEKNERDCIRFLLNESDLPEFTIDEAEDGFSALEQLSASPAQILLTDIKMPRIDGLELIKKVINQYPDMHIIIFSGYADFAYAQKAISLGVSSYILKPIVPDELYTALRSLIQQIHDEESLIEEKEKQHSFMLQYALQLSINGNFEQKRADSWILDRISSISAMIMLQFKDDFLVSHYSALYDELRSLLDLDMESLNLSPQQALLFIHGLDRDLYSLLTDIEHLIDSTFHSECYISAVDTRSEYDSLMQAFNTIEQQLEQRFWYPAKHIFIPGTLPDQEDDSDDSSQQLVNLIMEALSAKNPSMLEQYLNSLFLHYQDHANQSQIYIKFVFSNIATKLYPHLPKEYADRAPSLEDLISNLYMQENITDIISTIKSLSDPIISAFSAAATGLRRETLLTIKYLKSHYGEPVSVESLASHLYITPDYLSRLFKKDIGKSLSQYIRQLRMEKARDFLLSTNRKIVDIGELVGYPNYSYFCQSFREYYGLSPEKYRQEHSI